MENFQVSWGFNEVLNSLQPGASLVLTKGGAFEWVKINGREFGAGESHRGDNGILHRVMGTLHDGERF